MSQLFYWLALAGAVQSQALVRWKPERPTVRQSDTLLLKHNREGLAGLTAEGIIIKRCCLSKIKFERDRAGCTAYEA